MLQHFHEKTLPHDKSGELFSGAIPQMCKNVSSYWRNRSTEDASGSFFGTEFPGREEACSSRASDKLPALNKQPRNAQRSKMTATQLVCAKKRKYSYGSPASDEQRCAPLGESADLEGMLDCQPCDGTATSSKQKSDSYWSLNGKEVAPAPCEPCNGDMGTKSSERGRLETRSKSRSKGQSRSRSKSLSRYSQQKETGEMHVANSLPPTPKIPAPKPLPKSTPKCGAVPMPEPVNFPTTSEQPSAPCTPSSLTSPPSPFEYSSPKYSRKSPPNSPDQFKESYTDSQQGSPFHSAQCSTSTVSHASQSSACSPTSSAMKAPLISAKEFAILQSVLCNSCGNKRRTCFCKPNTPPSKPPPSPASSARSTPKSDTNEEHFFTPPSSPIYTTETCLYPSQDKQFLESEGSFSGKAYHLALEVCEEGSGVALSHLVKLPVFGIKVLGNTIMLLRKYCEYQVSIDMTSTNDN